MNVRLYNVLVIPEPFSMLYPFTIRRKAGKPEVRTTTVILCKKMQLFRGFVIHHERLFKADILKIQSHVLPVMSPRIIHHHFNKSRSG
ncbi:hypothetical protein D3C75_474860 [compost metagenome]